MQREDLLIYQYPVNKLIRAKPYDVTMDNLVIGDLHSNAMKLIHILIQNGVADLNPDTLEQKQSVYEEMAAAYLGNDTNRFRDLVHANLVFNTNTPFIRLIGDTLSDRGINDQFVLEFYNKMFDDKVEFAVTLSNHDVGFLNVRFKNFKFESEAPDDDEINMEAGVIPCTSLINFIASADEETKNRMLAIYDHDYMPNLKIIDYQFDPDTNTFSLCTHAPFGLKSLKELADQLNITFDLEHANVGAIIAVIDKINDKLPELIRAGDILASSTNHEGKDPLWKSMWQTLDASYDPDDFRPVHNGINFRYQHGHTTPEFVPPQYIDVVDNIRGKGSKRELDDQIVMNPETVPVNLGGGRKRMAKESDLHDHIHSRGINAVFYKRLGADIKKLESESGHQARSPGTAAVIDAKSESAGRLAASVRERVALLPQTQKDNYIRQLQAKISIAPAQAPAMLSPAANRPLPSIPKNAAPVNVTTTCGAHRDSAASLA